MTVTEDAIEAIKSADSGLLLDDVATFVRRYCVLADDQVAAVALWVLHTHSFEAAECTPYLYVSSPTKRAGKSTLLATLQKLAARPLLTSNISEAALFRVIEAQRPSLLFDEVDAVFNPKAPREELRNLLNVGFRRGAMAYRCGGANRTTLESFSAFCPKILAGIGASTIPDTIADRSIEIRMRRKLPSESVGRFRERDVSAVAEPLRLRLEEWGAKNVDRLALARPELPDELDDRAQDVWEPLLAIADLAGGRWPSQARTAALRLSGEAERDEDSRAALLQAIRDAVIGTDEEAIFTRELLRRVSSGDESPFTAWWNDAIDGPEKWAPKRLGKVLHEFGIPKSITVRVGSDTAKGYRVEWFSDSFSRYLAPLSVEASHTSHTSQPAWLSEESVTGTCRVTDEQGEW